MTRQAKSKIGTTAQELDLDTLCVQCEEVFSVPAVVLLDGGTSACPHCGWRYQQDDLVGKALDALVANFLVYLWNKGQ